MNLFIANWNSQVYHFHDKTSTDLSKYILYKGMVLFNKTIFHVSWKTSVIYKLFLEGRDVLSYLAVYLVMVSEKAIMKIRMPDESIIRAGQ